MQTPIWVLQCRLSGMLSRRRASVPIPKFVNLAARSRTNFGFGALTLLSLMRAQFFDGVELFHPAFFHHLTGTRHRERAVRHVLHDHRAGADIGAFADLHRRHQRRVRADEGILADFGAVLFDSVVIAEDGAGTDIGALADAAVADIGKVISLGALAELRRFYFYEIADARALANHGAGTEPREWSDRRARRDMRALEMGKRADRRLVLDHDARAEDDVGFYRHVAAEFGIGGKINRFRRDQCRPRRHRAFAQPFLQDGVRFGELLAVVDAHDFLLRSFADGGGESLFRRDRHCVAQIKFLFRVPVADRLDDVERMLA